MLCKVYILQGTWSLICVFISGDSMQRLGHLEAWLLLKMLINKPFVQVQFVLICFSNSSNPELSHVYPLTQPDHQLIKNASLGLTKGTRRGSLGVSWEVWPLAPALEKWSPLPLVPLKYRCCLAWYLNPCSDMFVF